MTTADETRLGHLQAFYAVLDELAAAIGGPHTLASSNGRSAWPRGGIYFFFESGETRTHGDDRARVVRVGTLGCPSNADGCRVSGNKRSDSEDALPLIYQRKS